MATYYVKTSGGNYSNDGLSAENAFDTIQLAADTVSAGDDVLLMVMADGEKFSNEPAAGLSISTNGGTGTDITWSGTNSSAVVDGTVAIADGSSMTGTDIISLTAINNHFRYISAEDRGSGDGWDISGGINNFLRCGGKNCANGFNITAADTNMMECTGSNNTTNGFINDTTDGHVYFACVAHDNVTGFDLNHVGCIYFSLIYDNSANGILDPYHVHSCTVNNTGGLNIRIFLSTVFVVISNTIMTNGLRGISVVGNRPQLILNNAFYSNTADNDSGSNSIIKNSITVTADPFTNAASGDFSLNNDPDGGQLCKQAGVPAQFPDTSLDINTQSFPDIGAVQTKLAAKFGG